MTAEKKEGYVTIERVNGIASIEFFHPQSNSLPGKLLDALAKAIHAEGLNTATKVMILRSSGEKIFCAGAAFDELLAITSEEQGLAFFSGFANVLNAMREAPKCIIARIHGKCVGGGVGLAAAADYAIAVEGADIKLSELAVGIGPFVIGPAVERKLGLSAFSQLTIDATMWRSADWALRKGLFAELHTDLAGMDQSVKRLATTLSNTSPEAMREVKNILWKGTENWNTLLKERAAISGRLILSDESKSFLAKFHTPKTPTA
ncbi:MAG: enoyl-CoA hydratase-related protein [Sediminibacterium sp.]|nr:enoyl-CoA hydratase-related protein [Sediminibacterium sp.]MDP1810764.1 enoyl-CoA hydratase-related protein [Sediminibacterium sp.]MDP3667880.1 enoyl-CoA hydratase-related protein [Sediminibacterium sp.]